LSVVKVSGLYRYPVQSVRGESLAGLDFGRDGVPGGVPGDRAFSIADLELGVVAHASRARKNYRPLITWSARYLTAVDAAAPVVELDFADGTSMRSDDAAIDRAISDRLEMKAALVRNDGAAVPKFYELSHCHILSTATLRRLGQEHESGIFAPERFRPNIFLDAGSAIGFLEQEWLGSQVRIGAAMFDVNDVCKRCALTTRAQGDLPDDPGILHATVANKTVAGVYASVALPGAVKIGDAVRVAE
jgi:uncharacterized protein YcbX